MIHAQSSAGITCAIFLAACECLFAGEAQSGPAPTKVTGSAGLSERSIHRNLAEGPPNRAKQLLDQGAHIDARNAQGATPLITASGRGNIALVSLLASRGAWIDAADHEGNTALHEASFYGQAKCVEILLAAGAQPSARNALKFTPLHQAVRRFWEIPDESVHDRLTRQAEVIRLLLQHGADPALLDSNGRTPVVLAAQSMNTTLQQAFKIPSPRITPSQAAPSSVKPVKPESSGATPDSTSTHQLPPPENPVTEAPLARPNDQGLELPPVASTPEKSFKETFQSPVGSPTGPLAVPPKLPDKTSAGAVQPVLPETQSQAAAGPDHSSRQSQATNCGSAFRFSSH